MPLSDWLSAISYQPSVNGVRMHAERQYLAGIRIQIAAVMLPGKRGYQLPRHQLSVETRLTRGKECCASTAADSFFLGLAEG